MRCQDLMTSSVLMSAIDEGIADCARRMRDHNVGFMPVVDPHGLLEGVVTDRDLAVRALARDLPGDTPVASVMTRSVVTCGPDDELRVAEERMVRAQVSRVIVVANGGRCVGVISLSDVLRVEESMRAGDVVRAITARESSPPPSMR